MSFINEDEHCSKRDKMGFKSKEESSEQTPADPELLKVRNNSELLVFSHKCSLF